MGIFQWAAAIDTAGALARVARSVGRGALAGLSSEAVEAGAAQMQARLAGVAVAAIKEVFERDTARL